MPTHPIRAHTAKRVLEMQQMPIEEPPEPWYAHQLFHVGGLLAVGFAENSDLLLVISTQGRSVIDCCSGTKIARDRDDEDLHFDEITLKAHGFGPLDGHIITIAGLYGGGLPLFTHDGWNVKAIPLPWPYYGIFLRTPPSDTKPANTHTTYIGDAGACELRAYGFSPTGQSLIIATSCDLLLFSRIPR